MPERCSAASQRASSNHRMSLSSAPLFSLSREQMESSQLETWKSLLPIAVERARQTYTHSQHCIASATASVSSPTACGSDGPTLCDCGRGKDLPPAFIKSMKSLPGIGKSRLDPSCFFYRAALLPLYTTPGMYCRDFIWPPGVKLMCVCFFIIVVIVFCVLRILSMTVRVGGRNFAAVSRSGPWSVGYVRES